MTLDDSSLSAPHALGVRLAARLLFGMSTAELRERRPEAAACRWEPSSVINHVGTLLQGRCSRTHEDDKPYVVVLVALDEFNVCV
jgi:hypothetical protein